MKIAKGIEIVDLGLFFRQQRVLVVCDLHIGFEEALNKQGLLIPRFQLREIIQKLEKIIQKTKPKIIVINGDVKHEFGTISEQEWRETLKVIDFLAQRSEKVVLIKGNHDTILGPIAGKRQVEVVDSFAVGDACVMHGHRVPGGDCFRKAKLVVIGHEHPAVSIYSYPRSELFKCYLKGKFGKKVIIVMPSFNLVTEGTDVLKEALLSPLLQGKLDEFEVFVVEDKVYPFGKLKNLRVQGQQ